MIVAIQLWFGRNVYSASSIVATHYRMARWFRLVATSLQRVQLYWQNTAGARHLIGMQAICRTQTGRPTARDSETYVQASVETEVASKGLRVCEKG